MLTSLTIQNLILIDQLSLDMSPGMTAFTGETGAGKSMLLDALDLLLGGKGDKSLLRDAAKNLNVSATFAMTPAMVELLEAQGIESSDDDVILRRTVDSSGKSKAFIHTTPVPLATLKMICEQGVEIHGQMDRLLRPSEYRACLDAYGAYPQLLKECAQAYKSWVEALDNLKNHEEKLKKAEENLERLRFEEGELATLSPVEGEESSLDTERTTLKSLAVHHTIMRDVQRQLESGLQPMLYEVQRSLSKVDTLLEWEEKLDTLGITLSELEGCLKSSLSQYQNPERLEEVEERLSTLRHLARKHKIRGDDLYLILDQVRAEILALEQSEKTGRDLHLRIHETRKSYETAALNLSEARKGTANLLSEHVQRELPDLKLEHAVFEVQVNQVEVEKGTGSGIDRVDFLFQANPGSTIQSIHKVASGGELSRLMLALKVVASQGNQGGEGKTTIIFDEIDSGVGGAVAAAIGAKLKRLSLGQQVLSITHAPQVASYADHHYKVLKSTDGTSTQTDVQLLSVEERAFEIARMLSGEDITPAAHAAAKALMKSAVV